jgi:hypothetical protein
VGPRELTGQFLRDRMWGMKFVDGYEAACNLRRSDSRTVQTYRRRVESLLRFHHGRSGPCARNRQRDLNCFVTRRAKVLCQFG